METYLREEPHLPSDLVESGVFELDHHTYFREGTKDVLIQFMKVHYDCLTILTGQSPKGSVHLIQLFGKNIIQFEAGRWILQCYTNTLSTDTLSTDTLSTDTLSADTLSADTLSADTLSAWKSLLCRQLTVIGGLNLIGGVLNC
jgi:hypothetical protein